MTTYRPEIDFLRAIAIISVFIFHLYPRLFPNGFLGVDVFFVLSGYLITNSLITRKEISLSEFYIKRIKRILPSVYLLILTTCFACIFFLLPNDLERVSKTAIAALTFTANIDLKSHGYFDSISEENPFLHMWSLAIEEQFYIFWPLILLGITKVKKNYIRSLILAILFLYSFITNATSSSPEKQFFLIQYRAYELLIGCITAIYFNSIAPVKIRHNTLNLILVTSLYLFFFVVPIEVSIWTKLLLLILTAWSILSFSSLDVKNRLYAPLISIGKNSFQIYLWHWPLIAFFRYIFPDKDIPLLLACTYFLSILILSDTIRKQFETKIYKTDFNKKAIFGGVLFAPATCLIILSKNLSHIQNWLDPIQHRSELNVTQQFLPKPYCHQSLDDTCSTKADTDILLAGDSNAGHYLGYIKLAAEKKRLSISLQSADACPPIFRENDHAKRSDVCYEKQKSLKSNILKSDIVVLGGNWPLYFKSDSKFNESLLKTINFAERLNKKVYVLARIPELNAKQYYSYLRNRHLGFSEGEQNIAMISATSNLHNSKIAEKIKETSATLIDPFASGISSPFIDGILLYKDPEHLNYNGSKKLYKINGISF